MSMKQMSGYYELNKQKQGGGTLDGSVEVLAANLIQQVLVGRAAADLTPRGYQAQFQHHELGETDHVVDFGSGRGRVAFHIYNRNPPTLARHLAHLSQNGFVATEVRPVDLFLHTGHVETVDDGTHRSSRKYSSKKK